MNNKPNQDTCPTCDGLGYIFQGIKGKVKFPCPTCGGSGRIPRAEGEQPDAKNPAQSEVVSDSGGPRKPGRNLGITESNSTTPPSPDTLEIDDIILLTMEAGRELAKEYEKYDGDMDWSAFVAKHYPEAKAALVAWADKRLTAELRYFINTPVVGDLRLAMLQRLQELEKEQGHG